MLHRLPISVDQFLSKLRLPKIGARHHIHLGMRRNGMCTIVGSPDDVARSCRIAGYSIEFGQTQCSCGPDDILVHVRLTTPIRHLGGPEHGRLKRDVAAHISCLKPKTVRRAAKAKGRAS